MPDFSARHIAKVCLPQSVRRVLRGLLHYVQRIGRWLIILRQVRGATWRDQWTLLRSALVSPILALRKPLEWQDPILLADTLVDVRGVGRFFVRARCDDLWHVLPWREHAIASVLHKQLKSGDTFIDAGANIGVYSVLASRLVGPLGKVLSVEMMPDTAAQLQRNLTLNKISNVTIFRQALSNTAGKSVMAEVTPGKHGQASIAREGSSAASIRTKVETTTLDEISKNEARVALVKMDLEGAEYLALHGGHALLEKTKNLLYESWGKTRSENNPVDSLLRTAGFDLRRIDGNNWLAEKLEIQKTDRSSELP